MFKNKTLTIVAAVVILALLGVGAYLTLSKSAKTPTQTQSTPSSAQKPETSAKSFMDILSSGVTQKCTFDVKGTSSETNGTLYVSAAKVRGNFSTTTDGKKQDISIIRDGDTNYIWGSALPQGIKMTVSTKDFSSDTQTGQYLNPNEKTDYKCSPWIVDSSLFTPPSNVKFMELPNTTLPKTSAKPGATTGTSPCDGITDPATKASCINALQNSGQ